MGSAMCSVVSPATEAFNGPALSFKAHLDERFQAAISH